jgi:hypothetical protein
VSISCFLASLTCFFASLIVVSSMGPIYVYKDMLDNVVSHISCVSMNHQNQLEQMANGAMFATLWPSTHYFGCAFFVSPHQVNLSGIQLFREVATTRLRPIYLFSIV